MDSIIEQSIISSVNKLIAKTTNSKKIKSILTRNEAKPHFVPMRYRVLGGILQSMNIQFGNFLEDVITNIVRLNDKCEILPESGKKKVPFFKSDAAFAEINRYINDCQNKKYSDLELGKEYKALISAIHNKASSGPLSRSKKDLDLWFLDKKSGTCIYCEIKYNDDHDTGKFVDINRKVLDTYSLLLTTFPHKKISAHLCYFTDQRKIANPYIPETEIFRGNDFFERYTSVSFEDIDEALQNISTNPAINEKFDELASEILERDILKVGL